MTDNVIGNVEQAEQANLASLLNYVAFAKGAKQADVIELPYNHFLCFWFDLRLIRYSVESPSGHS